MGTARRDLNELETFIHVARFQSFTEAARHLGMPKSSVSRAMTRLELRLGVRLLERTTRYVRVTEAGELYLERCRRVLEEAEEADHAMSTLLARPRGRLRVAAPVMFARVFLAPVVRELIAEHPQLRIQIELFGTLASMPRDERVDLLIRPGPLEDSGLFVKPLMRVRLGIFASPEYLAGRDLPTTPAALRQHRCITTSCTAGGQPAESAVWRLRRNSELAEIRVESCVAVVDPALNQQLAIQGVGVALLSQVATQREVQAGRLVRLLPEWEPEPLELHALYGGRQATSPKVRVFTQTLKRHLSKDVGTREAGRDSIRKSTASDIARANRIAARRRA